MEIKLHKVDAPARSDAQWLGTVVDDYGVKGSLVLSADGVYSMVQRGVRFRLDQDAVTAALAEIMSAPQQFGRPPLHEQRMSPRMVTLRDADVDLARAIGDGNVSAGLRLALDHWSATK